jgi:hypothetical protein
MRLSHTLVAAAAVVTLSAVGSPAGADTPAPASAVAAPGTVTLFGAPPAGPVWQSTYTTCGGQVAAVRNVHSFDNRPVFGCQVVLIEGAQTFELCAGRGSIPAAFRASPLVRIEPGTSTACLAW